MKKTIIITILLIFLLVFTVQAQNTLSLDNIDYQTGGTFRKQWLLTIVETGDTDTAIIRNLGLSDGSVEAENELTLRTSVSENVCSYGFVSSAREEVTSLETVFDDIVYFYDVDTKFTQCQNTPRARAWYTHQLSLVSWRVQCFRDSTTGFQTPIEDLKYGFKEDIVVEVQDTGKQTTACITNDAQSFPECGTSASEKLNSDGLISARWTGNLGTGINCPQPEQRDIVGYHDGSIWKTADNNLYEDYKIYDRSGFDLCVASAGDRNLESIDHCFTEYNTKLVQFIAGKTWQPQWLKTLEKEPQITDNSFVNGRIELEVVPLNFPVTTIKIDAEWVGIKQTGGDPNIRDVSTDCFQSQENGLIILDLENSDSQNDGNFEVKTVCDSPVTVVDSLRLVPFNAGERKDIYIRISGSTNEEEISRSCTITVTDRTNGNTDAIGLNACVKKLNVCNEDTLRCFANEIQSCQSNTWVTQSTCSVKCVATPTPHCESGLEICDNGIDDDDDGLVDLDDPECTQVTECSDGLDNDNDGSIDLNDSDCESFSDDSEEGIDLVGITLVIVGFIVTIIFGGFAASAYQKENLQQAIIFVGLTLGGIGILGIGGIMLLGVLTSIFLMLGIVLIIAGAFLFRILPPVSSIVIVIGVLILFGVLVSVIIRVIDFSQIIRMSFGI